MRTLLAILVAVIGANLLFFHQPLFWFGSLGFFLTVSLVHCVIGIRYIERGESRRQTYALGAMLLSILFAGFSLFRASEIDVFFLGITSLAAFLGCWYIFALERDDFGAISEILFIPVRLGTRYLWAIAKVGGIIPHLIRQGLILSSRRLTARIEKKVPIVSLLRGITLTVGVVFVLVTLLSSADPVFSKTISSLFSFHLPTIIITVPERVLFSLIIAVLVSPLAYFSLPKSFHSPFTNQSFRAYGTEMLMLTGAVGVVLGLFLLIQARYLFFAVPDITLKTFGISTYSEYVRRGFGELLLVTMIVYGVVAGSLLVVRQTQGKYLQRFNVVLLGEILLLIFSVFRRLALYQAEHGLTRIRIYGSVFLLVLLGLSILLILRHTAKKLQHFYLYELSVILAGVFLLGLLNVDHMIGSIVRPTVNGKVDYYYISRLSPDAVQGWLEGIADIRQLVDRLSPIVASSGVISDEDALQIVYADRTIEQLTRRFERLYKSYGSKAEIEGWLATIGTAHTLSIRENQAILEANISSWRAYQTLRRTITPTEFVLLRGQVRSLYSHLTLRQQQAAFDRSLQSPLVR